MSGPETISNAARSRELETQIAIVRDSGSASAVHQMRVAAGRLSVWLELCGRTALRDDLRWLRRAAMHVRDADVMLAARAHDGLRDRLLESRAAALASARRELATSRTRAILAGLAFVPSPTKAQARACLQRLLRRTLRAGDALAEDERDPAQFHRLRRRVRRTRYALEWLAEDAAQVKELQDALGSLNDLHVELAHLDTLVDSPALATHRTDLEAALDRARAEALAKWSVCRPEFRRLLREGAA